VRILRDKSVKKIFAFLFIIGALLFARQILAADFGLEIVNNGLNGALNTGDPRMIAARIINLLLGFLSLVALVLIIYSGYLWMTSAGNEDKVTQAKRILKNGAIGLLIILSSWAIATFLISQFYGATTPGPVPNGCIQGATLPCGCEGHLTCDNGSWSQLCEDEVPANCTTPPISCDSDPDPNQCVPLTSLCGTGYYCDNVCLCQHQGGLGDSCDSDSDPDTCTADNTRCSEYLVCNPDSCLCDGPPVITGISPVGGFCVANLDEPCLTDADCATNNDTCDLLTPNGTRNNFITIFGKSFGTYSAASSKLIFMGSNNPKNGVLPAVINPLCINSWYDDQIVVAVPQGVTTGPIKVINLNNLEDTTDNNFGPAIPNFVVNNINRPGLCYLNPNQGNLGSEVDYQGINLFTGKAFFGNYQSNVQGLGSNFNNVTGLSGTSTTPNINAGDTGSFVEREISGFPQKSNYLKFIKDWELGNGPYIISFNPPTGQSGQYVTIRGAGFGGAKGENGVYFDNGSINKEASYAFPAICANSVWKDNQIIVKVPEGLINGDYQIQIEIGTSTITTENLQPNVFEVDSNLPLKTSMCRINPERGPIATPVSIWGEYFGASPATVEFNINTTTSGIISLENDAQKIDTAVPVGAVTGPVRVMKGSEWGNELNFVVGECIKDSDCNEQVCCPANTYKKGRCVDDQSKCYIEIPNSVFEWGFSTELKSTSTLPYDSCFGMAQYLGSCWQGAPCPNSPGSCSSPATNYPVYTGNCDRTCSTTQGCGSLNPCVYDSALDICKAGSCDLPKTVSLGNSTTQAVCNSSGKWEIETSASCPAGWIRGLGNTCTQGTCSLCDSPLNCTLIGTSGTCVSEKLCSDKDAKCVGNPPDSDRCEVFKKPSCECCCRIGFDQQDCCAGLKCSGKCGSDIILAGGVGTCCNATGTCINPNCPGQGGIVNEVGGYCTHTFTSTNSFKTPIDLNASILVVGGGGAAGGGVSEVLYDAGGGGGQVVERTLLIPNIGGGDSPVIVGAGGTYINSTNITNGGDSSFLTVTAVGGKKANYLSTGGTSGSGKIGGTRLGFGSGGGGDSENGSNAPANQIGGDGGDGTYSNISGTSIAYGGGGAGMSFVRSGQGGLGSANPGGGGSGSDPLSGGKNGIIIIRYPSVPAASCPPNFASSTNTFGNCSGCGLIGTSTQEHDMACNCSGSTSKFCDISVQHPEGICVDCAQASGQESCGDHSSVCCFDSKNTAETTDDSCLGLNGRTVVSNDKLDNRYGYCSYFNCTTVTPPATPVCASTTPFITGVFASTSTCITDCPQGIGNDPCSRYMTLATCMADGSCCYDGKKSKCITGTKIPSPSPNVGYCAYYNCQVPPAGDPYECDLNATTTGAYISTSTCIAACPDPYTGPGLDCVYQTATSDCNTSLCNYPAFSCLKEDGGAASYPACGTCCCSVSDDHCADIAPALHCQADRGSCTGAGRGLCCGCTADNECGSLTTTGCGNEGCCQARPEIVSTLPLASATDVCRNASIKITFNQAMDLTSFGNNFLLFEEREYNNGVCPAGTFLTDNREIEEMLRPKSKNIFARLWDSLNITFGRLLGRVNDQALAATPPSPSKLYCGIPGTISSEESGAQTSLIFAPSKLLSASTKYYVVVKGDELLNSQNGVLSVVKIGMYGEGLDNGAAPSTPSAQVKFNGRAYLNSYSFQFTTLSNQGANAGICAVDHVNISPASYLFKTTNDDLNENDTNASDATFDTVADRDKVFTAGAYSVNNQLLNPVTGYNWNWDWVINNSAIVTTSTVPESPVTGLPVNRRFVQAQPGVTDGQAKISATVNMDSYNLSLGCTGPNCNAYLIGDKETKASDVYVFICNNPWPAVNVLNGEWSPWDDEINNCSLGDCKDFDYRFYYCRDSGAAGTLDDLPAILNKPRSNGQINNSNLLCSYDRAPCSDEGDLCGQDANGDGHPDGICSWNILKESYFFREEILSGGEITNATSTGISGEVRIDWQSPASGVDSYKIYYLKSGKGTMFSKEVKASSTCRLFAPNNICSTTIDTLINDQPYVFQLSVISNNKTESTLSNEKTATPKDSSVPTRPRRLTVATTTSTVKFEWLANPPGDNVVFYRLYRGIVSGFFGESFDSAEDATSMTFDKSQFVSTTTYFALSAINTSNHESVKSQQVIINFQ